MSAQTTAGSARATRQRLLELINANWTTHALGAAAELRLADLLSDGHCSVDALATAAQCDRELLSRLLRALVTLEFCVERDDSRFELTPLGELLRDESNASLRGYALFRLSQQEGGWSGLAHSVRTGTNHRLRTFGRDDFSNFEQDSARAALFQRAMVELTKSSASDVASAYPFAECRHIIDVGGGYGELLATVLAAHPSLSGTVFDLPHAVAGARAVLGAAGVADRCSIVTGSFFDAIPAGGDAYLLKSVLHDWDDARTLAILACCRAAMLDDAKLLIVERIVSERLGWSARDQAVAAADLNMLVSLSGKERTEAQFRSLLDHAGFNTVRVIATGSAFSVIEATPRSLASTRRGQPAGELAAS